MKVIIPLIVLSLILFSGCIDDENINYASGFNDGKAEVRGEVTTCKNEIKLQLKEINNLSKELERKTEVTTTALNNEAKLIYEVGEYNDKLDALYSIVDEFRKDNSDRINDLNTVAIDNFEDLNKLISDLNKVC